MLKNLLFTAALLALLSTPASAQFLDAVSGELPPYNNPTDLLRDHLLGTGIEILDVQFDGDTAAVGYFTGGNASIGLERGLIMSTGHASTSAGSYGAQETGSDFANTDNQIDLNDNMLAALTTGPLNDLVRYRITFRASSDSIRFRYVFASEEYPEFACSVYNDVFGFFLEGPGYPAPVNIARIPGSNLPVAINNIHFENPNDPNCFYFNGQYYNDNNEYANQPTYDGFLDVFTAEAAVQPCGVYVMTLAIADVSDGVYDSAVFLEANSFGGEVDVAASFEPGDAVLPENAVGDTVSISLSGIPQVLLPLTVTLGGTAQNGVDYELLDSVYTVTTTDTVLYFLVQPLPDSLNELFETVSLTVRDTGCFFREFTLFIADPDSAFKPLENVALNNGTALLTSPTPSALNNLSWNLHSNDGPILIDPTQTMVYSNIDFLTDDGGKPANPVSAKSMSLGTLGNLDMVQSVCVNIDHNWVDDLSLYLFAPDGKYMELSSGNGGNGDNYTNTCFSPSATESITMGLPFAPPSAAPFTGTFQPEGDWNDLLGAPLDGVWRLGVIDNNNGFVGQLLNWSIDFSGVDLGHFQYLWSTGETTETISVDAPGEYTVTVSNAVGALTKTFVVLPECAVLTQVEAAICPGATYSFGGEALNTAGVYTQTLQTTEGCDSLITLTLSILPTASDSLDVVLAAGETYNFGGQILSQSGDYVLQLLATNGCDSTVYLHLSISSSATEPGAAGGLQFSPNPSTGETLISWDGSTSFTRLRVYDMDGRLVISQNIAAAESFRLNTSGWSPGWYTVELEGRDGSRTNGRLLVR